MRENALWRGNARRPNVFGNALGNYVVGQMGPKAAAPVATSGRTKDGGYYNLNIDGHILNPGMDTTPMEMPAWFTDDAPTIEVATDDGWNDRFNSQQKRIFAQLQKLGITDGGAVIAANDLKSAQQVKMDEVREIIGQKARSLAPYVKDGAQVLSGALTAMSGVGVGFTGAGAPVGVGLVAIGVSEAADGIDRAYNRAVNGVEGDFNLLRRGLESFAPGAGGTAYDAAFLFGSAYALTTKVPLNVGVTDRINRVRSIFGVEVSKWNNPVAIPFSKKLLPEAVGKASLMYGVGSKGANIVDDLRQEK